MIPKPVARGNPLRIPAEFYNLLQQMAREYLAGKRSGAGAVEGAHPFDIILVKNVSDTDVAQFGILGIHDILFTPTDNELGFKERPALCGTTPDADLHTGKFVVCLDPIPCAVAEDPEAEPPITGSSAGIGRALLVGATPVQIDVIDEDHAYADVKDGDSTQLQSCGSGAAQILYKESGTGTKWAVVRLGVPPVPFRIGTDSICLAREYYDDHASGDSWSYQHAAPASGSLITPDTLYNAVLIGKFERPFQFRDQSRLVVPIDDHTGAVEYLMSVSAPASSGMGRPTISETFDLHAICEDFDETTVDWTAYTALEKVLYGSAKVESANGPYVGARTIYAGTGQSNPSGLVAGYNSLYSTLPGKQVFGFGLILKGWTSWLGADGSNFGAYPHLHADQCYAIP